MKKIATGIALIVLGVAIGPAAIVPSAYASKVDCTKVMQELNSGVRAKDVASGLKISLSSVYRCKRRDRQAQRAAAKAGNTVAASPAASPAAP